MATTQTERKHIAVPCFGFGDTPKGHELFIEGSWRKPAQVKRKFPGFIIDEEHVRQCPACTERVNTYLKKVFTTEAS